MNEEPSALCPVLGDQCAQCSVTGCAQWSPECFSGQNQAAESPFSDLPKKGKREDLELGGCSSEDEIRVSFPSFTGSDKHQHSAGQG